MSDDSTQNRCTLHYHGSCSNCHHFHRHVAFDIPEDDATATRFLCERCRHPMFGLGRTNTQITLASQDSFPLEDGTVRRPPSGQPCNDRRIFAWDPQLPTLEDSHSVSHCQQSGVEDRTAISNPDHNSITSSTNDWLRKNPTVRQPWSSNISYYVHRLLQMIVGRFSGVSRQYRLLGIELSFRIASDYHENINSTGRPLTVEHVSQMPAGILDHEISSIKSSDQDPVWRSRTPVNPSLDSLNAAINRRSTVLDVDQAAKEERLRNHRRDQTLRKRALQKGCDCTESCHCKLEDPGSATGATKNHSSTASKFESQIDAAEGPRFAVDHEQQSSRSYPFVDMGDIFDYHQEPRELVIQPGGDNYEHYRRTPTNMSNASTISLHPGRPIFPQRSASISMLSSSPITNDYPTVVADVFRRLDGIHRKHSATGPTSPVAWLQDAEVESHASHQND